MIVLADKIRVTQPYEGKSKFSFWKDIQKGDVLTIAMELKPVGKYRPYILVTNERTKEKFEDTINALQNYLQKLSYEEVIDRSVSDEIKYMLVRWLADEYIYTDAKEMIANAHITAYNDKITITYDNGMADVVKIEKGKVISIY